MSPTPDRAEPNGNPAESKKPDRNDRKTHTWEYWKRVIEVSTLVIELLGLAGLVWYCIVTQYEWKTFDSERQTMEKEFLTGERAWVSPSEFVFVEDKEQTNWVTCKLIFKNTGKTPALNVLISAEPVSPESAPATNPPPTSGPFLIAPDGTVFAMTRPLYFPPFHGDVLAVAWVYGRVSYEDIFHHRHWTDFCRVVYNDFSSRPANIHNSCDDAQ